MATIREYCDWVERDYKQDGREVECYPIDDPDTGSVAFVIWGVDAEDFPICYGDLTPDAEQAILNADTEDDFMGVMIEWRIPR